MTDLDPETQKAIIQAHNAMIKRLIDRLKLQLINGKDITTDCGGFNTDISTDIEWWLEDQYINENVSEDV